MPNTETNAVRSRKLPASLHHVMLPFVLSVLMTCIVSGVATWHNLGLVANFASVWLGAWVFSWTIAFPALLLVLPLVRRIVAAIVETPGGGHSHTA